MNEFEWHLLEDHAPAESVLVNGTVVKPGDTVRLRPKSGGDIMDLALTGKLATVAGIEQDYEGKTHVVVVVAEDPGRDLGMLRQPGHQFFFEPEEIELVGKQEGHPAAAAKQARVLIAGIGNIFLGDDGFGVEVVRRMREKQWPGEVEITDFGIRGYDLAYALLEPYEAIILVDACPRGDEPGTIFLIEPDLAAVAGESSGEPVFDAHTMNPMNVLRLAKSLGSLGDHKRILLLGCEPYSLGPEEGQLGLSEVVERALGSAVQLLETTVFRILASENPGGRK